MGGKGVSGYGGMVMVRSKDDGRQQQGDVEGGGRKETAAGRRRLGNDAVLYTIGKVLAALCDGGCGGQRDVCLFLLLWWEMVCVQRISPRFLHTARLPQKGGKTKGAGGAKSSQPSEETSLSFFPGTCVCMCVYSQSM